MRIYVNGEERNLHVYDKIAGVDYAKNVICAQDRLDTDDFGAFTMTEEEFEYWRKLLVTLQDSEDIRFPSTAKASSNFTPTSSRSRSFNIIPSCI